VLTNADLLVAEQNVVITGGVEGGAEEGEAEREVRRVARALDLCGDVGVWAEWVWGRTTAERGGAMDVAGVR
jgi:hypothetical protein